MVWLWIRVTNGIRITSLDHHRFRSPARNLRAAMLAPLRLSRRIASAAGSRAAIFGLPEAHRQHEGLAASFEDAASVREPLETNGSFACGARNFAVSASGEKKKILAVLYKAGDAARNPKLLGERQRF